MAAGQVLRNPGLDSAANWNWIQGCGIWNQASDRKRDRQGPLQMPAVVEESEIFVISHFYRVYDMCGME